jgi:hypothetical protein
LHISDVNMEDMIVLMLIDDRPFLAYPVCCQYDESVIICRSGLPRLSNNASRFSAGFSR